MAAKQFLTKETFRECLHKMADGRTWELKGINRRGGKDTVWLKKHGTMIDISTWLGSSSFDLSNEGKELELYEGWDVVDLMWNHLTSGHGLRLYVKSGIMERLAAANECNVKQSDEAIKNNIKDTIMEENIKKLGQFVAEPETMEVEEVGFIRGYGEMETAGLSDDEKAKLIQDGIDSLKRKVANELIEKGYIKAETSEFNDKTIVTAIIYVGKEETRQGGKVKFVSPDRQ